MPLDSVAYDSNMDDSPSPRRCISSRVENMNMSAIKQMGILAAQVEDTVSLCLGLPSFNTPKFIRDSVVDSLNNDPDVGKYTNPLGMLELRQEIAHYLHWAHNVEKVDVASELLVNSGSMEALATAVSTVVDTGDEVLLLSPAYASHIEQVVFAQGTPVFVPLMEENGWRPDIEAMGRAVTSKTKAVIICNPTNPTGTVLSTQELLAIAEIVIKHDLYLITDQAYDFLVYDTEPSITLASVPELKGRLISTFSFSKHFCLSGWRVGFTYADESLIAQMLKVHDAFQHCAPRVSQLASIEALRETNGKDGQGDLWIQHVRHEFATRREVICDRLSLLPGLFSYSVPEGSYYIFPRITLPGYRSMDLAMKLLYDAKVVTAPGIAFGPEGEGHLRMIYGADEAIIHEAFDRIEKWFKGKS